MKKSIKEIVLLDDFRSENMTHKFILVDYFDVQKVSTYQTIEEAINYLIQLQENNQHFPEYIFIDINMPLFSGWEFIGWYKYLKTDLKKHTKLIVLTGTKLNGIPDNIDPNSFSLQLEKPLTKEKLSLL